MDNEKKEKKPIYKKWWFWVLIVIVVAVIATASGTGDNTTTPAVSGNNDGQKVSTSTEQNNKEEQQNSNNEKKQVKAGEEVTSNNVKISFVSSKDYTDYNQYTAPDEGNKIVRVEFSLENISKSDINLSGFECYADGEKCQDYYLAKDYKNPTLQSLSSGKRFKAVLYYQVPKNAKETILEYQSSIWSKQKVEFIVK